MCCAMDRLFHSQTWPDLSCVLQRRIATMDPARIAEVAVTSATDGAKVLAVVVVLMVEVVFVVVVAMVRTACTVVVVLRFEGACGLSRKFLWFGPQIKSESFTRVMRGRNMLRDLFYVTLIFCPG